MVIGIGTDIVDIQRLAGAIERHPQTFLRRVLTPGELAVADAHPNRLGFCAGRWAAKEAVAKALGVGFGEHCHWQEIVLANDTLGKPDVTLAGTTAGYAASLGITRWHLSISHEDHYAVAFALAENTSL